MNVKITRSNDIAGWKPSGGQFFLYKEKGSDIFEGPYFRFENPSGGVDINTGYTFGEHCFDEKDDGEYRPFYGTIEVTP